MFNSEKVVYTAYKEAVRNVQKLTPEEEAELSRRVKAGDMNALEKLVKANLEIAFKCAVKAAKYVSHDDFEDIIQEATMALYIAAKNFDPNKARFSTYAYKCIKYHLRRAYHKVKETIHVPDDGRKLAYQVKELTEEMYILTGSYPSVDMMAELLDKPRKDIVDTVIFNGSVVSLDTPLGEETDMELGDILPDPEASMPESLVLSAECSSVINQAIDRLTESEQNVVYLLFGFADGVEHTLDYVGNILGVSRERVRQLNKSALKKLRESLRGYIMSDEESPEKTRH